MAERDAFGNEIGGKDSLADMGWAVGGSTPPSVPTTPPDAPPMAVPGTPSPQPPRAATPAPAAPSPMQQASTMTFQSLATAAPELAELQRAAGRTVRRAIRLVTLVVTLLVVAGIVGAIISSVDTVKKVTDNITVPSFTVGTPSTTAASPTPETPSKPSKPPEGLQPGSMLRADAFAPALTALRKQGSRVQTMRIDAQRISANLLTKANAMRIATVDWQGNTQLVKTPAHITGVSVVSLASVTSKAPSRAVARAAAALGRPARSVDYVVLTNFAGQAKWFVYFKGGHYFSASLDGRRVARIG